VEILERKITEPENIARLGKLGVANLPTIVINGEVKFISVIPNRDELKKAVSAVL
jgi:uroporphyrinogen decarboxylase